MDAWASEIWRPIKKPSKTGQKCGNEGFFMYYLSNRIFSDTTH